MRYYPHKTFFSTKIGRGCAKIDYARTTETIRYQYDNHLGSSSLELDEDANIISYEEYHPFGTTSYRSGRKDTEVSLKRYKYTGKERDEETGLYYYGARYYAGWIGRFVSVDPLQFEYPQLTPYNYAGNKPITHLDIDGMQGTGDEPRKTNNIKALTSTAQKELDLYTKGEYTKGRKNKRKQKNSLIELAFAEIIDEFRANKNIIVNFTTNYDDVKDIINNTSQPGGTIGYSGKNESNKDIYWVYWSNDKTLSTELGASGIFEETKHLQEAIQGKEMAFKQATSGKWGVAYLDINDEVRAKMWVAKNINIHETYEVPSDLKDQNGFIINYNFSTHYGYIKELGNQEDVRNFLRNGKNQNKTVAHEGFGRRQETNRYVPSGGKYSNKYLFPDGNLRAPAK